MFSTRRGLMTVVGLEIRNVTQADGGTYSVKATNVMGEANANINLNFSSAYKSVLYVGCTYYVK